MHLQLVTCSGHTGLFQLVMELAVGILNPSVAVKQRMRFRIRLYCMIECFEDQRIVIPVSLHIGNDSTVIEVHHN